MPTTLGCAPSLMLGRVSMPTGWLRRLAAVPVSPLPRNSLVLTRGFSSPRQQNQAASHVTAPKAISWLTQTPHRVTPPDIVSQYPLLSRSLSPEPTVPVLFVTPAFASWIDPTTPLLESWARPLLGTLQGNPRQKTFYIVAAVVDKIPVPQNRIEYTEESINNGAPAVGFEGLSLLLAGGSDVRVTVAEPTRVRGTTSEEPAFIFSALCPDSSSYCGVGLRLANTVFVTGKDRTLLGMRWDYDSASKRYNLSQCYDLAICSITSPAEWTSRSLKVPLHPVTQRRKVVSSMGNILRQVSKSPDGNMEDAMPASSELERELPRYVQEHGITDQRVSVWALVEPSEASSGTRSCTGGDFQRLIQSGSRIHRVVSGGGGWGKKQGLLSLDPEVTFRGEASSKHEIDIDQVFNGSNGSAPPEVLPDISDILSGGLEENMASLSQVAKAGDHIQFFVSSELHSQQVEIPKGQIPESSLLCEFVVAGSSEAPQVIPSSLEADREKSSTKHLVSLTNYFGAVSEKAITYSQNAESTDNGPECRTKLCVPGSRVELAVGCPKGP